MKSKEDLEKELEAIRRVTNTERNLLQNIYDDFFGNDVQVPGMVTPPASGKKGNKTAGSGSQAGQTDQADDAVRRAEDVLKEAKAMFGGDAPVKEEEEKPEEPEEDPMEKLNGMIGLTTIKHDVRELTDFAKVQKMRQDQGMKSVPVSLHLVFTGNPGTGKTTVARILGKLYKQIGVLSKGQLIEVDRSGLVAGYVGQTAIKTQEQIKKAMGGILFIDEAYALARKDDAFGQEAIDTILKAMEDNRDDLVVVVAGYTKPMEQFINSNPGLKSRFNKYIEFPDYTVDELEAIFNQNCERYDYKVDPDIAHQIRQMIVSKKLAQQENFANAREVRNMFEDIITNQARRVAGMENPSHEDMMTITLEDLTEPEELAKAAVQDLPDAPVSDAAAPEEKQNAGQDSIDAPKEDSEDEGMDGGHEGDPSH